MIPREEVTFARRGFAACDRGVREHLEGIGGAVLAGYHAALLAEDAAALAVSLREVDPERRGYACEGAAMAMAMLDHLTPWPPWRSQRWVSFQRGAGAAHPYMVHVGAGLALARSKQRLQLPGKEFDPLLCWLVADGYGFHEGFFRWKEISQGRTVTHRAQGYARRAFDQGLGRSLWFVCGAGARRIDAAIRALPPERWSDLWSGVGLACAYAGGVERAEIESLRGLAERFGPELAQGVAFAAQARARAGNPAEHTEVACRVLCGCGAGEAAEATVLALEGLSVEGRGDGEGAVPAFEVWRRRIQARFGAREAA